MYGLAQYEAGGNAQKRLGGGGEYPPGESGAGEPRKDVRSEAGSEVGARTRKLDHEQVKETNDDETYAKQDCGHEVTLAAA
jgi:hypothetical protein